MAGEVLISPFVRSGAAPAYSSFAFPVVFPGCNLPCKKTESKNGTAPGLSIVIPVTSPVGRSAMTDFREAVNHVLGVIRVGKPSSG